MSRVVKRSYILVEFEEQFMMLFIFFYSLSEIRAQQEGSAQIQRGEASGQQTSLCVR